MTFIQEDKKYNIKKIDSRGNVWYLYSDYVWEGECFGQLVYFWDVGKRGSEIEYIQFNNEFIDYINKEINDFDVIIVRKDGIEKFLSYPDYLRKNNEEIREGNRST